MISRLPPLCSRESNPECLGTNAIATATHHTGVSRSMDSTIYLLGYFGGIITHFSNWDTSARNYEPQIMLIVQEIRLVPKSRARPNFPGFPVPYFL